ncbi:MAG: hypothetical protein ABI806_08980 [Candidatus Solibacter sp.]
MIRVLIADDHGVMRKDLRLQLEQHEGIDVVGEAPTSETVCDCLMRVAPGSRYHGHRHAESESHRSHSSSLG